MDTRPFCARESRFMTDIGHLSSVAGQSSVTPSKSPAARKKRLSPHERLHIAFRTPSDPGIVVAPASLHARARARLHQHTRTGERAVASTTQEGRSLSSPACRLLHRAYSSVFASRDGTLAERASSRARRCAEFPLRVRLCHFVAFSRRGISLLFRILAVP